MNRKGMNFTPKIKTCFSKENREIIIAREKGKCYNCGDKGIEIHHIIANTKTNRLIYRNQIQSVKNGVLVCKACHNCHAVWDMELRKELEKKFVNYSKINT